MIATLCYQDVLAEQGRPRLPDTPSPVHRAVRPQEIEQGQEWGNPRRRRDRGALG